MLGLNNNMVMMMTTPEVVTTIEVVLMTIAHEDKQVIKLAVKDAQAG